MGGGEEGSGTKDEAGPKRALKRVLKIPGTGVTTSPLGAGKDGEAAEGGGGLDSLPPNRARSDALRTMPQAAVSSGEGEIEGGETESWRARRCGSAADGVVGGRSRSADVAAPHTSAGCQGGGGGGRGDAREGGKVDEVAAPPKFLERMRIPGLRQRGPEGGDVEGGYDEVAPCEHEVDLRGAGGIDEEGGEGEKVGGRGGKRRKVAIDDDDW